VAAVFLLVGSAFVGFGARDGWFTRDSSNTATSAPSSNASTVDNSNTSSGVDSSSAAASVQPAIVNITSITDNGVAAGTGMLISSKGLVVTNHHVISGARSLQVEVGGNGDTYDAHVVGYSIADDVALVQIEGVSGLPTISTTNDVAPDDTVQVIGNALGKGGEPTVTPGRVVALSQSITATDETGSSAERLTGMIQISAAVQPGQSGGAVVNADGDVVGMTTAAAVNGGYRFGFDSGSSEAYAIPIARALAAVKEIEGGSSTADVHVGSRAVLGVAVQATTQRPAGGTTTTGTGVPISGVTSGGPADKAGLTAGSTIVAIGDVDVNSVDDITKAMNGTKPGDSVKVTWIDPSGNRHSATLDAAAGPPA
jgi:S1-C subfamily serine protease